ncbi:IclR family transcriptional regulator domain-containing protein [Ramlibacter pinisoli]|uniref:IclR family transcriptional regulator domain-containing protein n=1 Tax=Ramlibacter pinisoli TaxID=2682844 RepID=UPI0018DFD226
MLQLLTLIAQGEGEFGVKDVAQGLDLAPSTAHRLLNLLLADGFVARSNLRRYRIGPEFLRMARMALDGNDIVAAALEPMRAIVDACGETCLLAVYHPHRHTMSFVARVDSANPLRYRVRMHGVETLAWGATGRSILAFLPDPDIQQVIARAEISPGSGRKLSVTELKTDLAAIRARGYAVSRSQRITGAVGLSVPVYGEAGRMIGSLSVTVPEQRFRARDEARLGAALITASTDLSRALGVSGLERPADSARRASHVAQE